MDTKKAQASIDQIDEIRAAIQRLLADFPEELTLGRKWIASADFDLGRAKHDVIMTHNERRLWS